jgi:predicted TIM-barrel fold metal-dependent hydrolase
MTDATDSFPIVDCDVHPAPRSAAELLEYLPDRYQGKVGDMLRSWFRMNRGTGVLTGFGALATGMRRDAMPKTGPGGSDPSLMEEQLLVQAGVTCAILIPLTVTGMANPEHEAALCAATNAWLADNWLGKYNGHGRYRGSIMVCPDVPEAALEEIERWSKHGGFVQVMIPPTVRGSYGLPQYFPIFEAAVRHGLPVATHINRTPGIAMLSPVGFVSYYFEFHPQYTLYYYPHVASLVMSGVFARLPDLRFVLVEGGVSWLAPFMWRLDHYWRQFGSEVPWLDRPPSEYVRNQILVTTQPLERPNRTRRLHEYLNWMGSERMVMFSTDYPHWDYDHPEAALLRFPDEVRAKFAYQNAAELYGLADLSSVSARPLRPAVAG